jgi:hypothetical protein
MRRKEDERLYNFCNNVRRSQQGKGSYRLDDDQIPSLDAIGFEWEMGAGATAKSNDDRFFTRVDDLKAYKEKHGHLKVCKKEDISLHIYCSHMRQARRAIILGKGTTYKLTEDRIAALDAIGFNWNSGTSSIAASSASK